MEKNIWNEPRVSDQHTGSTQSNSYVSPQLNHWRASVHPNTGTATWQVRTKVSSCLNIYRNSLRGMWGGTACKSTSVWPTSCRHSVEIFRRGVTQTCRCDVVGDNWEAGQEVCERDHASGSCFVHISHAPPPPPHFLLPCIAEWPSSLPLIGLPLCHSDWLVPERSNINCTIHALSYSVGYL